MFARTAMILALGASAAIASPVAKRQVMPSDEAAAAVATVYQCPTSFLLTYVHASRTYPDTTVERAYEVLSNWGAALPSMVQAVNATGSGEGANRFWTITASEGDVTKQVYANETLTMVTATPSTRLEQEWVSEYLVDVVTFAMSNYDDAVTDTNHLTLYSNETTKETTLSLWSNFCADDQEAGLTFYTTFAGGYLQTIESHFKNASFPVISA